MSAGDITRLNRMYNCPIDKEDDDDSSITLNRIAKSLTQFPNGVTIKRVELNKTTDNADDPQMEDTSGRSEMELNPNRTLWDDEDDMILSKEQIDALFSPNAAKRNGLKNAFHHWPMGIVAFEIDPTFSKAFTAFYVHPLSGFSLGFNSNTSRGKTVKRRRQLRRIRANSIYFPADPKFVVEIYAAMAYIQNVSCINFKPRASIDQHYIYIAQGPGCSSEVGLKNIGKQLLNINEKSCQRGKIIHELLHSLGFLHMHTAK